MKRIFTAAFLTITLAMLAGFSGCSINPATGNPQLAGMSSSTPEAQIAAGANAETAAAGLASALLKNGKLTVSQAKSMSTMLHAASSALDDANKTLLACRASTGSTAKTSPDPCALGIVDVIKIATTTISGVQSALATK